MSKQQAWILIAIAAVAVGALIQMNRYEYFEGSSQVGTAYILRIDRLTGQECLKGPPPSSFGAAYDALKRSGVPPC
jgi:hypothetical protein